MYAQVESAFVARTLHTLVATTTLAAGVNLPVRVRVCALISRVTPAVGTSRASARQAHGSR
jgi:replicative superfamily II helicase